MDPSLHRAARSPSLWYEPPSSGDLLWEFARDTDGTRFRCELRPVSEGSWQVIFYANANLLAWHSGFVERKRAVVWATGARRVLERRVRQAASTKRTQAPPLRPPVLYCANCATPLRYTQSFVTQLGRTAYQWDHFQCPRGCGDYEYRPSTRRLRRRA
jgi:hypothetical protein